MTFIENPGYLYVSPSLPLEERVLIVKEHHNGTSRTYDSVQQPVNSIIKALAEKELSKLLGNS